MENFLEVLKIIDGAVNADRAKVVAYAEQLAGKLEAAGDRRSAEGVRRALAKSKARDLAPARMAGMPVDGESRLALADEQVVPRDAAFVALEAPVEERVREFVRYVGAADALFAHGVGISPSLLVSGPPGCGKTELARRIAAEIGLPLLTARTDTLMSSFLGSTAKNLRMLFEHAMARPCVLFLDEFDALAKLRDDQHELGELKRVVVSLLQNIDALDSKTVLLAATNHEHLLDPAIWRRFAFHLKLGLPSADARENLLRRFLGPQAPSSWDALALARLSEGLTGAQLRQICEDARRSAIVEGNPTVCLYDMLRRVVRVRQPDLEALPLAQRIVATKALDRKLFTVRVLHEMYGVSVGKISNVLQQEGG